MNSSLCIRMLIGDEMVCICFGGDDCRGLREQFIAATGDEYQRIAAGHAAVANAGATAVADDEAVDGIGGGNGGVGAQRAAATDRHDVSHEHAGE